MRLRSDGLHTTQVDGETVILDTTSSTYFTVNGVGTVVLTLLAGDTTEDELAVEVAQQFGIPEETAREDCRTFIGELRSHGFLLE